MNRIWSSWHPDNKGALREIDKESLLRRRGFPLVGTGLKECFYGVENAKSGRNRQALPHSGISGT